MDLKLCRSVLGPPGSVVLLAALWLLPALACGSGPLAPASTPVPLPTASPSPSPTPEAPPTAVALPSVTPAPEVDLSGAYAAMGTNFDGSAYRGRATIARERGSYRIEWQFGEQVQHGTGALGGSVFSVRWNSADEQARGAAEYALQPDGSLSGTWTIDGAAGQGTETLTPIDR